MFIEGNPEGNIEDVTYNARPYFSLTPVNDLNFRMYVDNVFVIGLTKWKVLLWDFYFPGIFFLRAGFTLPTMSFRDRSDEYDINNEILPNRMHVTDRAGVFKVKYLYYF